MGQFPDVPADLKARVLDRLFSQDAASSSFLTKMTLRYGDSDTQLVVLIHPVFPANPGGRAELISYSIAGIGKRNLSLFISKILDHNPNATDREIAAQLKVDISRSAIGYEALNRRLDELKEIRISPLLASRVAVDEYSDYGFWYDAGQESVHYSVVGPFDNTAQDELVKWMIKFRADVPMLLKAASTQKQ